MLTSLEPYLGYVLTFIVSIIAYKMCLCIAKWIEQGIPFKNIYQGDGFSHIFVFPRKRLVLVGKLVDGKLKPSSAYQLDTGRWIDPGDLEFQTDYAPYSKIIPVTSSPENKNEQE